MTKKYDEGANETPLERISRHKKSLPLPVRPPQLAASFSSSRASSIPRQLPMSPMRVFPVGVKHPLDVPVQRGHDADPRHHGRAVALDGISHPSLAKSSSEVGSPRR